MSGDVGSTINSEMHVQSNLKVDFGELVINCSAVNTGERAPMVCHVLSVSHAPKSRAAAACMFRACWRYSSGLASFIIYCYVIICLDFLSLDVVDGRSGV